MPPEKCLRSLMSAAVACVLCFMISIPGHSASAKVGPRALIVVAHPDDEYEMAGTIYHLAEELFGQRLFQPFATIRRGRNSALTMTNPKITIVYRSGYGSAANFGSVGSQVGAHMLPKPFSKRTLLLAVAQLLHWKEHDSEKFVPTRAWGGFAKPAQQLA